MNAFFVNSISPDKTSDILYTKEGIYEKNISSLPVNNMINFNELPYFPVIGGDFSYLSFNLIYRNDGAVAVIPQNVLGNFYYNSFKKKVAPVFNKALKNLLNIRNHLLLQLDLECGNISEEYFDKEETKYLTGIADFPVEKLKEEIEVLLDFSTFPLDSEDISEILNCSVDDTEKVLQNILTRINNAGTQTR